MLDLRGNEPATRLEVEELATFFKQSLDLLCVADREGQFRYLNPAWTRCLGWTAEELTDSAFLEFVHPDDIESTAAELEKLSIGVQAIRFENRYLHRDGSYRWLEWNARSAVDRQLIFADGRDGTRIKFLEREIIGIADAGFRDRAR